MNTASLTAASLSLCLLLAPAPAALAGDQPRGEKEIVVDGDRVFNLDDDDSIVVHSGRHARRGHLGVQLIDITPDLRAHFGAPRDAGVLIAEIEPDSPAAKAGLQVGDVITRVDHKKIGSSGELAALVRGKKPGATLQIEIERGGAAKDLTATLEEREKSEIELGDLRLNGSDWDLPDLRLEYPLIGRGESLKKMQKKLEDLDKRLKDLEKKLPAR